MNRSGGRTPRRSRRNSAAQATRDPDTGLNLGVAVGAAAAGPGVFHAVMWQTQPVSAQLATVSGDIAAFVGAGILNSGQGTALTGKLDNAAARIAAGNFNAARGLLTSFINQVQDFVSDGTLSAVDGQGLVAAATALLDQLP